MSSNHKILEGLNEVVAFTGGDHSAANLVEWRAPTSVDVRSIRAKMQMTQKQFAARFGFSLETLRNWEQEKRVPDSSARVLLTIIDRDPEGVKKALAI
ncbi:helix-turn-helix domain-containing protein [Methylobacterium fujisawaense]|uniref:helix-turn-helix domain-containing protein n=1 Tax=Methylobacterium fujisawaense TaxID=107400 RepID=UPI003CE7B9B8